MLIVNYLLAVVAFAVIYLAERLVLFWLKKKESGKQEGLEKVS